MAAAGHRLALGLFAGVILLWLAIMAVVMRHAALPADAAGPMLVVFEPGTDADEAFTRLVAAGATPVGPTAFGFIWMVSGGEPGLAGRLRDQGALGAYAELPLSPTVAGCFAYADAKLAGAFQP